MRDGEGGVDKAVAVKYQKGLPAPFILAKGRGSLARRLVDLARANGIEIMDVPELADSLITLDAGDWIPEEYFEIIAEVLAFVYQLKAGR